MSAALELSGISKTFDAGASHACHDVHLELRQSELLCLLGPSGCGKSTLLKIIAGYVRPDSGRVLIQGRDTTHVSPEHKNIGMVFQSYALFPHLTARENVEFGLRMRGVSKPIRGAKALELMQTVGLSKEESGRYPHQLSGGQQQRVAIARALVIEPVLLLLDEPMANLDRRWRERMRAELKRIQRTTGVTTILVTHDQEEAMSIGDRIAVMHAGRILQCDVPEAVYQRPSSLFVGRFLGEINLFDSGALTDGGAPPAATPAVREWTAVRPENVRLGTALRADDIVLRGRVQTVTYTGPTRIVALELMGGREILVRMLAGTTAPATGEECSLCFHRADTWTLHDD